MELNVITNLICSVAYWTVDYWFKYKYIKISLTSAVFYCEQAAIKPTQADVKRNVGMITGPVTMQMMQ